MYNGEGNKTVIGWVMAMRKSYRKMSSVLAMLLAGAPVPGFPSPNDPSFPEFSSPPGAPSFPGWLSPAEPLPPGCCSPDVPPSGTADSVLSDAELFELNKNDKYREENDANIEYKDGKGIMTIETMPYSFPLSSTGRQKRTLFLTFPSNPPHPNQPHPLLSVSGR